MPHHAVIMESSDTTRLRIGFEAWSHGVQKLSLNEYLEKGPMLNSDMLDTLANICTRKIAVTADVQKAILQVGRQVCSLIVLVLGEAESRAKNS